MTSNYHQKQHWRSSNAGPSSQKSTITSGLCGLFFTAENEKRAVPEAKNLIDRFLEEEASNLSVKSASLETTTRVLGPNSSSTQFEDVSDSLKSACREFNQNKRKTLRQLETKARNTLFFISPQITPINVYVLAEKMVKFCLEDEAQTRFLAKVIPIEETCYASMPQILSVLSGMLTKNLDNFAKEQEGENQELKGSPTYAIDFKARNTQAIERQPIYDEVNSLISEQSKGSKVNLTTPDLLIVVHAIRTVAFLSIIRNYSQNKKYALRKSLPQEELKEKNDGGDEDDNAENDKLEGEV